MSLLKKNLTRQFYQNSLSKDVFSIEILDNYFVCDERDDVKIMLHFVILILN